MDLICLIKSKSSLVRKIKFFKKKKPCCFQLQPLYPPSFWLLLYWIFCLFYWCWQLFPWQWGNACWHHGCVITWNRVSGSGYRNGYYNYRWLHCHWRIRWNLWNLKLVQILRSKAQSGDSQENQRSNLWLYSSIFRWNFYWCMGRCSICYGYKSGNLSQLPSIALHQHHLNNLINIYEFFNS